MILSLAAYCLFLCWKRRERPFCAPPEPALFSARLGAGLRVAVDQPPREDARGLWEEGALDGHAGQRVRLRWKALSLFESPRPGETVELKCALKRPRRPRNPGEFDERRHLEDRGVQWTADCDAPILIEPPHGFVGRTRAKAEDLRRFLERRWREKLSALDARLMSGLVLGYKGALDRALAAEARDAGVIHLLVPSGAKIAFILLAVGAIGAFVRAPPAARLIASFFAGGFFTLLMGGEPPYTRAWLSACFAAAAGLLGRDGSLLSATIFSAWLQLLWDPAALFTPGFQMSYACAAALSMADFSTAPALARVKWITPVSRQLATTCLVEAALWPVFASGFGRAAVLGALANVILVPASVPLVGLGWAAAFLPGAPAVGAGLAAFRAVCGLFAGLPGAAVDLSPMSAGETAAFYLALSAILLRLSLRGRGLVLAAAAAVWGADALNKRADAPPLSVLYLSLPRLRPGAVVRRRTGPPLIVSERSARAVQRAASLAYGWGEPAAAGVSLREAPRFRACEGKFCLRFDRPCFVGPAGEFCILALLKKGAVEVSTDGSQVRIRQASDPLRRRLL